MNEQTLRELIAGGESLTAEFKSDRGPLPDADLVETVVCLANGQGGMLLLGVEDDGCGLPEGTVGVVAVPAARQPTSTSDGRLLIRYWDVHGRPGCRPLYAYELTNWQAERGQADATALILPGATWEDLDPLEFARLRRMIQEDPGDQALLELPDQEIAKALGLVRSENGHPAITLAGLLLVGKEEALRRYLPAHEVAFQILRGLDVAMNEFRRWPLLRIQEWLMEAIGVRNEEQELMVGGVRIGVPRYDRAGIREAVNNALIHRDYTRLGAIHVQLRDDHVRVSNPGGFVQGVRPDNLLVVEPRPRNPRLADAFKRIGLVERTGRGVDTVYRGQLRNGRLPPDYSYSNEGGVLVRLEAGRADLDFVRLAVQAGRRQAQPLSVAELLALWLARREGMTNAPALAPAAQVGEAQAGDVLAALAQAGILAASGRAYRVAPELYRDAEVAPQALAPEDAILAYVEANGRITRREAREVTNLSEDQTYHLLKSLVESGGLELVGRGRTAYYRPGWST